MAAGELCYAIMFLQDDQNRDPSRHSLSGLDSNNEMAEISFSFSSSWLASSQDPFIQAQYPVFSQSETWNR
jgi:hypothetical protein